MTIEEARSYLGEEYISRNRLMTDVELIATAESIQQYHLEEDSAFFDIVERIIVKPK